MSLTIAGRDWETIIDTGFNGDLELPIELKDLLPFRYIGEVTSLLAGGQSVQEDVFHVQIPFDGQTVLAETTFVRSRQILLGTRLLREHRLEVDFPEGTVTLQRGQLAAGP